MVTKLLHRPIHSFITTATVVCLVLISSRLSLSLSFGPLFSVQLKAAQKDLELPPEALLAAAAPDNGLGFEALHLSISWCIMSKAVGGKPGSTFRSSLVSVIKVSKSTSCSSNTDSSSSWPIPWRKAKTESGPMSAKAHFARCVSCCLLFCKFCKVSLHLLSLYLFQMWAPHQGKGKR